MTKLFDDEKKKIKTKRRKEREREKVEKESVVCKELKEILRRERRRGGGRRRRRERDVLGNEKTNVLVVTELDSLGQRSHIVRKRGRRTKLSRYVVSLARAPSSAW